MHEIARNLRSVERFLLEPPISARFGEEIVAICDVSERGARFRHSAPLQTGAKAVIRIGAVPPAPALELEAVIVWTQQEGAGFVSGARTFGPPAPVQALLDILRRSRRAQRIEEMRSTERFLLSEALGGVFDGAPVAIEDLSARGARITLARELHRSETGVLRFEVTSAGLAVEVRATVMWSAMKSIATGVSPTWRAGLLVEEQPERLRLAIGSLTAAGRAAIDPHSLGLKIRILKARARQLADTVGAPEWTGIPAEQYLLVQGVREELKQNPEEAMHWYRRARLLIADPPPVARPIAGHPDALAVWEYLQRSLDPSIVARAFELRDEREPQP
jgi:hypothetical protein